MDELRKKILMDWSHKGKNFDRGRKMMEPCFKASHHGEKSRTGRECGCSRKQWAHMGRQAQYE